MQFNSKEEYYCLKRNVCVTTEYVPQHRNSLKLNVSPVQRSRQARRFCSMKNNKFKLEEKSRMKFVAGNSLHHYL
jgi:hypothetical protein